MSTAKVELGRRLFYDTRLSVNGTYACGTCHVQAHAFTDTRARALGATGAEHPRSAMALTNVAFNLTFGWMDPSLTSLEAQAAVPMMNEHPIELGLKGHVPEVLARFATADDRADFAQAFPQSADAVSLEHIIKALATFERTLISGDSPFDRYLYRDDRAALDEPARRGMALFFSKQLKCSECHSGFNLSGPALAEGSDPGAPLFHDTGDGRFRAPTLRNIDVTAPYMHDGRLATLDDVIAHYARGGSPGPGKKSRRLSGFRITAAESADLVQFLKALTDAGFLSNSHFSPPQ